jgi:hypothetical protein
LEFSIAIYYCNPPLSSHAISHHRTQFKYFSSSVSLMRWRKFMINLWCYATCDTIIIERIHNSHTSLVNSQMMWDLWENFYFSLSSSIDDIPFNSIDSNEILLNLFCFSTLVTIVESQKNSLVISERRTLAFMGITNEVKIRVSCREAYF